MTTLSGRLTVRAGICPPFPRESLSSAAISLLRGTGEQRIFFVESIGTPR